MRPIFTGILLAGESGQIDGVAIDDEIAHAADVAVSQSGRPQAGRDGRVVHHRADAADHQCAVEVELIRIACFLKKNQSVKIV